MTVRGIVRVMLAVTVAAATFLLVGSAQPTDAAWTKPKDVTITVTAATPAAPTNLRCVPASGTGVSAAPVRWDVPATGPTPTGYRITLVPGALVPAAGPYDTTTNSYDITAATLSLGGNWTMTVRAYYGDSFATGWTSAASNSRVLTLSPAVLGLFSYSCV